MGRRYASAFLSHSLDHGLETVAIARELREAMDLIYDSSEARRILLNKMVPTHVKEKLWNSISGAFKLSEQVLKMISFLVSAGRVDMLRSVTNHFDALRLQHDNIVPVHITIPCELANSELNDIQSSVADALAAKAQVKFLYDPTILGGMIVQWKFFVADFSVRNRLEEMKKFVLQS